MFESLVETITAYPYVGVAVLFLICGMGFPLPEEIVLIAAGYVCFEFPDRATTPWMMAVCGAAILVGDLIPFVLGRVFGTRLLRLRFMRMLVTRRRLSKFDRWFRKRGDLVIFIARFLAGIRMVAFFTAGTLKMRWRRFLLLDGLGIALLVPPLVWIGYSSGDFINRVIERVQQLERGILFASLAGGLVLVGFYWFKWRKRRRARFRRPTDTYVAPRIAPREEWHGPPLPPALLATTAPDSAAADTVADTATVSDGEPAEELPRPAEVPLDDAPETPKADGTAVEGPAEGPANGPADRAPEQSLNSTREKA